MESNQQSSKTPRPGSSANTNGPGLTTGIVTGTSEMVAQRDTMKDMLPSDFEPAVKNVGVQIISRPSLSYWQDAWLRLKKNKQSMTSLGIVAFLVAFTVVGPLLWRVDPAAQDLSQISQGPTFGLMAVVVPDSDEFELPKIEKAPTANVSDASQLTAPAHLAFIGEPSIKHVRLKWDPVPGATSYQIYRSEQDGSKNKEYGLPMGEVSDPTQVGYEDQLDLNAKTYYYTVVPTLNGSESSNIATIQTTLPQALNLSSAQQLLPEVQVGQKIRLPSHPMGTDYLGRDMLARLMAGARISLFIGFFAPILYVMLGILIGGLSGYHGGKIDLWLTRFTDLVIALPFLLFMILFRIAFGVGPGESGVFPLLISLIALSWVSSAKLVRGQVLQLRESEYVQAARLLGARSFYLLTKHLIPNTMGVILVYLTFAIPGAIFTEAFLSFIGMGVVPPTPSWGSMCNDGIQTILSHPHEFLFPGLMIIITVLAFNLLGDGLRDALDPKLRSTS